MEFDVPGASRSKGAIMTSDIYTVLLPFRWPLYHIFLDLYFTDAITNWLSVFEYLFHRCDDCVTITVTKIPFSFLRKGTTKLDLLPGLYFHRYYDGCWIILLKIWYNFRFLVGFVLLSLNLMCCILYPVVCSLPF